MKLKHYRAHLLVCAGTGCVSNGSFKIKEALEKELIIKNLDQEIQVVTTGCNGFCEKGPIVVVQPENIYYQQLKVEDIPHLVEEHFLKGQPVKRLIYVPPKEKTPIPILSEIEFFKHQRLVVLKNRGRIDPGKIDEYIAFDGYEALSKALTEYTREEIINEIKDSGLRGRGGGGFPAGVKWELCYQQKKKPKYIICNADEGDPGAFMDRSILESDPHAVLEGMIIGAYAIGANEGYVYVRDEYPLAVKRIILAIQQAEEYGLLGENILNSGFDFKIKVIRGAGAFVCGEETALIASVEGKIGEPRQRPPFPIQKGLWGKPTNINNVETWANVPNIINRGAQWFASLGTKNSKGTKIFSLVGKINNTGLVEVPMGIPLGDIIFNIGGGIPDNRKFKAVQTGGPSGGCLPIELLNLPVDYQQLAKAGSIMGSGGMVVMDEDTCMVDVAKYFLNFLLGESCGKCFTCRKGIQRLLELVIDITEGRGTIKKLELLEELAHTVKNTTQCGLGQTAANPVLSTLRYFKNEYIEHIEDNKCNAGVCRQLFISPCQNACPADTNAAAYIAYISAGRSEDAMLEILNTNPFPSVCGRVCDHPCQLKCRRNQIDDSVAIRSLKRFVGDQFSLNGGLPKMPIPDKKLSYKIGIIGGGPAGLSAAYFLARLGYQITVFEAHEVAGGMLSEAIPESRLPNSILAKEIRAIEDMGVEIKLNKRVGTDVSFKSLMDENFDAFFVAVGMYGDRSMGIEGEDLLGVLQGVDFLRDVNLGKPQYIKDQRVAVIGGGNTAVDAARTCIRLGAKEVTIIYRRTREEMPAFLEEINDSLEEGIKLETLSAPVQIIGTGGKVLGIQCIRMDLDIFGKDGRRKPVPRKGSEFTVDVDIIIPAIGEFANVEELFHGLDVETWNDGTIKVSKNGQTSIANIFAGGDISTGPATVIKAIGAGQKAAESIDQFLLGENNKTYPWKIHKAANVEYDSDAEPVEYSSLKPERISLKNRVKSFEEVEQVFTKEIAIKEAKRCLRCELEVEELRE
jgi:NADH-quinone oxidoreductase subunit F